MYKKLDSGQARPETAGKKKNGTCIYIQTASLRSVACDVVESTVCEFVCFGSMATMFLFKIHVKLNDYNKIFIAE